MKKLGMVLAGFLLMSCGNNALDGKASTDTTSMPKDPNMNADTVNHINANSGTEPIVPQEKYDSMQRRNEERRSEQGQTGAGTGGDPNGQGGALQGKGNNSSGGGRGQSTSRPNSGGGRSGSSQGNPGSGM